CADEVVLAMDDEVVLKDEDDDNDDDDDDDEVEVELELLEDELVVTATLLVMAALHWSEQVVY
ncbi:hypothetical protein N0V82_005584, partial [Gnomoniopsis sp. IMI 355080]